MNKNKEQEEKRQEKIDLAIKRLVNVFNHSNLQLRDLPQVVAGFLYSVGTAMLDDPPRTSEDVLTLYAKKPSFASALMAQAIHMKETWIEQENERKETNEHDIRRETENRESPSSNESIQRSEGQSRSDETDIKTPVE